MKSTASHHHGPPFGQLKTVAVGLGVAVLLAGCSVAATSPSPSSGPPPSPTTSAPAQPTASPTPNPTPTALPSPGAAPTGPWSGIRWISAGPVFPQTPTASTADGSTWVIVYGWSRGYVGFRTAVDGDFAGSQTVAMVSTSSTDGLHWTLGRPMGVEGLTGAVEITGVVEGPSGLLAVGRYPPGICGGPATVNALWTSTDGVTWSRVKPPADFASASVYTVDAGSTGYIATGTLKDGVTQAVWLSGDGRSWRRASLPTAFGKVVVNGATDFSAGYVISGAVLGGEGCGGAALLTPSLWWSADGKSWTRSKLTGAVPASDAWVTVSRISDHALMATASEWNQTTQTTSQLVWVTTNGRTWSLVASPSSMLGSGILTNGQRGLLVVTPTQRRSTDDRHRRRRSDRHHAQPIRRRPRGLGDVGRVDIGPRSDRVGDPKLRRLQSMAGSSDGEMNDTRRGPRRTGACNLGGPHTGAAPFGGAP